MAAIDFDGKAVVSVITGDEVARTHDTHAARPRTLPGTCHRMACGTLTEEAAQTALGAFCPARAFVPPVTMRRSRAIPGRRLDARKRDDDLETAADARGHTTARTRRHGAAQKARAGIAATTRPDQVAPAPAAVDHFDTASARDRRDHAILGAWPRAHVQIRRRGSGIRHGLAGA